MNPLFSVVVPIYKVELYLRQCIESVLSQTYKNFELILVDDGSPDNCPVICDEYAKKDERILVVHKENGGLVSARIAGAKVASGAYFCCVDGDDWIAPTYLEEFATVIASHHPDIICNGFVRAYEDRCTEHTLNYRHGYYNREQIEKEIFPMLIASETLTIFTPTLWAKAFKREIYMSQQLAVSTQIKIGEDVACTKPCIALAESLYILPGSPYYYRQCESAMTNRNKIYKWEDPKLVAEHLKRHIDMKPFNFEEQLHRLVFHELFGVVVSQFNRKEPYKKIVDDIKINIEEPIYYQAIQKARFKGLGCKLAVLAFKNNLFFLFALWNKVRVYKGN